LGRSSVLSLIHTIISHQKTSASKDWKESTGLTSLKEKTQNAQKNQKFQKT